MDASLQNSFVELVTQCDSPKDLAHEWNCAFMNEVEGNIPDLLSCRLPPCEAIDFVLWTQGASILKWSFTLGLLTAGLVTLVFQVFAFSPALSQIAR
jgi:hypothetical protein